MLKTEPYNVLMSDKKSYVLAATIGSVVGGYVPTLFHVNSFSPLTLVTGLFGGIIGIWVVYRYLHG